MRSPLNERLKSEKAVIASSNLDSEAGGYTTIVLRTIGKQLVEGFISMITVGVIRKQKAGLSTQRTT